MNISDMTLEQIDEELSQIKKAENAQHAKGRYAGYDGAKVSRQKQLMAAKQKMKLAAKKA